MLLSTELSSEWAPLIEYLTFDENIVGMNKDWAYRVEATLLLF